MRTLRWLAAFGLILAILGTAGAGQCENCGLVFRGDARFCPDCARRMEREREHAAKELVFVEGVVKARAQYEKALGDLITYYTTEGDGNKAADAKRELAELKNTTKYDYIFLADVVSPDLAPKRSIAEADRLFQEGVAAINESVYFWAHTDKYIRAQRKFEDLIKRFPESDKIDASAYYLGRCYEEGTPQDYRRAIVWYQRCYQWNAKTSFDPRYRIAYIYDYGLKERDHALTFYNLQVRDGGNPDLVVKSQRRISSLKAAAAEDRHTAVAPPEDRRP